MSNTYDVFVSYAWADRAAIQPLVQALRDHGLRVFVDDPEIEDFARITTTITAGLAASKVLLAYYSAAYPTRRACQWELTAAYLAASSVGDPSERILVVNPEKGADHLYPAELRDALFRRAPAQGDSVALTELADVVAARVAALSGPLGRAAPVVPPQWLPTQAVGSTRFVGRLSDMWRIHSALHPEVTQLTVGRSGPAVAQVRGLGGIGKTLLAEEYALRFGAAYPGGVFWLRAYGRNDPVDLGPSELAARWHDELRQLALALGQSVEGHDPSELPGLLAAAIQARGQPCLWVVDDLPDDLSAPQVRSWLAPHPLARTLLTTRSQTYGALATPIDLDMLHPRDAYELLTSRRPPTSKDEIQAAHGIVTELGGHALAIDVAGAALSIQQGLIDYSDFLAGLAEPVEDELELAADLADALPTGHEASIAATLGRSIGRLDPDGQDLLRIAACLAPAPIPADLIKEIFQRADGLKHKQATRRAGLAINQAAALSLTSKAATDDQSGMWRVHALVVRSTRYRQPNPQRLTTLREAAIAVLTELLQAIDDARTHATEQAAVPHARELARQPETTAEADLLNGIAMYDYRRGDFRSAELASRLELNTRKRLSGQEHPHTLISMSNLAEILRNSGDPAGARELQEQAIDICRRVLGPDHPDTLAVRTNLAMTLFDLGDLAGARDLSEEVIEANRRVLGPDHPNTLVSMNTLAGTLAALGETAGARDLSEQLVDANRRVHGPDHPDTLSSMNTLGQALSALGDAAGAANLHRQVLDARRRVLGPEHPYTLNSMNNLALALSSLDNPEGARDLLQQIIPKYRELLGLEHPDTLNIENNLALVLLSLRDFTGARDLLKHVATHYQEVLGLDHPKTLDSMESLALTLLVLGELLEARDLFEQILDIRRRVLGPDHPSTRTAAERLSMIERQS